MDKIKETNINQFTWSPTNPCDLSTWSLFIDKNPNLYDYWVQTKSHRKKK